MFLLRGVNLCKLTVRFSNPQSVLISRRFATMAIKYQLPEDFLKGPAPALTKNKIDFTTARLPQYENLWAVVLDGVMTEEECHQLVAAAEATTDGQWDRAMVNMGGGRQALLEDARNCGRIIWDNQDIMTRLWARIQDSVPEIHRLEDWADVTGNGPVKRKEVWKVTRLNERGRFLKYVGGEYFKGTKLSAHLTSKRAHHDSTLRWHLRDTRRHGTFILYPAAVPQRPSRRKWARSFERRCNHLLLPKHEGTYRRSAAIWTRSTLPASKPLACWR